EHLDQSFTGHPRHSGGRLCPAWRADNQGDQDQSTHHAIRFVAKSQPPAVLPLLPPPIFCWVYFQRTFENFRPRLSCGKSPPANDGAMCAISTFSSSTSKYLTGSPCPSARCISIL